jgi:hypothetical protein
LNILEGLRRLRGQKQADASSIVWGAAEQQAAEYSAPAGSAGA